MYGGPTIQDTHPGERLETGVSELATLRQLQRYESGTVSGEGCQRRVRQTSATGNTQPPHSTSELRYRLVCQVLRKRQNKNQTIFFNCQNMINIFL